MIHFNTFHQATIFFEVYTKDDDIDVDAIGRICDKAMEHNYSTEHPGVEVSVNKGGPCWGPSIEIIGEDEQPVVKVASRIETYIKRFKGAKFS